MCDKNENYRLIEESYTKYHDQLYGYIRSRIQNPYDVQDLFQTTFVRLLEYDRPIKSENIHSLLYRICSNLVNDYLRHYYTLTKAHSEILMSGDSSADETENTVSMRELLGVERKCMDLMTGQRRSVYLMRMHQGKSSEEIARQMGIAKRTVENHYYRGLNQMRTYLRINYCITNPVRG